MLVDQFTKWLECYPYPDQTAESIAKCVVDPDPPKADCVHQLPMLGGLELVI